MPPAPGIYTCIKSLKKLYKIRLQRDFFEFCNREGDKAFLLTSRFCPLKKKKKKKKKRIKVGFKEMFFKLATNE